MLGKNIFEYLTRCDVDSLEGQHDAAIYSFNSSIFNTTQGIALKSLIQNLIKPLPHERISVVEALFELELISKMGKSAVAAVAATTEQQEKNFPERSLRGQCVTLLASIVHEQRFGKNDVKMDAFELEQIKAIKAATDVNTLIRLRDTLHILFHDPIINAIHKKIASYDKNYVRFKAINLENAMANVPVEQRNSVLSNIVSDEAFQVQKALAMHRITGQVYLNKDKTAIDESKAVKSFTALKAQWQVLQESEIKEDVKNDTIKPT